ncbi:MAG: hypothetical protein HQL13_06230, partial [Candidatus Omnitrophica bacterium]|nr:hypothetical protein [Candidatus Omnitrophota bacterium]
MILHTKMIFRFPVIRFFVFVMVFLSGLVISAMAQDADSSQTTDKTQAVNQALNEYYQPSDRTQAVNEALLAAESTGAPNSMISLPSADAGQSASNTGDVPAEVTSVPMGAGTGAVPQAAAQLPSSGLEVALPSPPKGNTFKITGEARASVGIYPGGKSVFTLANADLDEKNWRMITTGGLNHNINTYDPGIYSSLKVVMDASVAASVVSVHLNLVADPSSYVGKSPTVTATNGWGDTANVKYLAWGNTSYTLGQIVNSSLYGDAFNLPEVKLHGNKVPAQTGLSGFFTNQAAERFSVPETKISY